MRFAALVLAFSFAVGAAGAVAAETLEALPTFLARARRERSAVSPSRGELRANVTRRAEHRAHERERGRPLCDARLREGDLLGLYVDGERAFEIDQNDTALPLASAPDPVALTLRAIDSYAFAAPEFQSGGGRIVERDSLVRAGRAYRRISVTVPHGAPLDALVDRATALVTSAVSEAREDDFELVDRRTVDGVTLPFEITLNGSTYERFDTRRVVDAPLETPRGLVPTFSNDDATLEMVRGGRTSDQPIVPREIGTVRVACLLDTGNSGLSLGYDVVLGADAFARARVTIDYGRHRVTLAAAATPVGGTALGVAFEHFIPIVPVRIGERTIALALDTGDESELDLAAEYYATHPTLFRARGSVPVAGIGGTSAEIVGRLDSVRLGAFEIAHPRIGATRRLATPSREDTGSGLLRHFIVTFDYARSRVELVPRAGDPAVRTDP